MILMKFSNHLINIKKMDSGTLCPKQKAGKLKRKCEVNKKNEAKIKGTTTSSRPNHSYLT